MAKLRKAGLIFISKVYMIQLRNAGPNDSEK
jgi:hypothetical protein